MKYRSFVSRCAAALIVFVSAGASATTIEYTLDDLGAGQFQYNYFVTNDSLATPIEQFTIYFDLGLYEFLIDPPASPIGWDGLAVDPDPLLPDDGFADWLALGVPLDPGATLDGFSVQFSWLGAGLPGSQIFEVVDPLTFDLLDEGFTSLRVDPPVGVAEPAPLILLGLGGLVLLRRQTGFRFRL